LVRRSERRQAATASWRLGPVAAGRQAVVDMGKLDAELCIIEPVFCDGEFGVLEDGK